MRAEEATRALEDYVAEVREHVYQPVGQRDALARHILYEGGSRALEAVANTLDQLQLPPNTHLREEASKLRREIGVR